MSKVFEFIKKESERQETTIELIASENFVSNDVLKAVGSCLINKYSEGYPETRTTGNKGRYYGGCNIIDTLEEYCCEKWKEAFQTDYHVNVQPHSGSQANYAAYMAILNPGDTILAMSLSNGGHLTHGSKVNFSGKIYNIVEYGVDENGYIDYDDIDRKINEHKPHLILAGASAYPRIIDFKRIHSIIDKSKAKINNGTEKSYHPFFMVDMSHIAGLIIGNEHPSPFGYADIITTTTHKTLRSARGAMIFCKKELASRIDSAVFPGSQGGPLQNMIAGKAIGAEEACTKEYRTYIHNVVVNCKAMCERFKSLGYKAVTDGTDNHMFLLDFSETHPYLTGKEVQELLDSHGITLNKNCVPNERRKPKETSGVRIGTAAMTTKGFSTNDFILVADKINDIIQDYINDRKK